MKIEQELALQKKKNESLIKRNTELKTKQRRTKQALLKARRELGEHYNYLLKLQFRLKEKRQEISDLMDYLDDLQNDL